jgi:hypothetical protein
LQLHAQNRHEPRWKMDGTEDRNNQRRKEVEFRCRSTRRTCSRCPWRK